MIVFLFLLIFIMIFVRVIYLLFSETDNETILEFQSQFHKIIDFVPYAGEVAKDIADTADTTGAADDSGDATPKLNVLGIQAPNWREQLAFDAHTDAYQKTCQELGHDFNPKTLECKYSRKTCNANRTQFLDFVKNSPEKFETLPSHEVPQHMSWNEQHKKCFLVPSGRDIACNLFNFDYVKPEISCEKYDRETRTCSRYRISKEDECNIPRSYCDKMGMSYSVRKHDCYVPDGQYFAETLVGKTVTRQAILYGKNVEEKSKKIIKDIAKDCADPKKAGYCAGNLGLIIATPFAELGKIAHLDDVGKMIGNELGPIITDDIGPFIKDDVGGFVLNDLKGEEIGKAIGKGAVDAGKAIAGAAEDAYNATKDLVEDTCVIS